MDETGGYSATGCFIDSSRVVALERIEKVLADEKLNLVFVLLAASVAA